MVEIITGVAVAVISAILVKKVAGESSPPPAQLIIAQAESTPSNNILTPGLGPAIYNRPIGFFKEKDFKEPHRSAKKTKKNR